MRDQFASIIMPVAMVAGSAALLYVRRKYPTRMYVLASLVFVELFLGAWIASHARLFVPGVGGGSRVAEFTAMPAALSMVLVCGLPARLCCPCAQAVAAVLAAALFEVKLPWIGLG